MKYIERFLFPHNKTLYLDDGIFNMPTDESYFFNNETISFENFFENKNCLIVLGENSFGKTEFLKHHYEKITDAKIWIDLKNIISSESVNTEIFNKNFNTLYKNNPIIYLFLDGLDEALNDFNKIHYAILSKLKNYNYQKVKIIISCRTFSFPKSFAVNLKNYYKISQDTTILYELTPFSWQNIKTILIDNNILDYNSFYEKTALYNLKPLLAKPILLNFIIKLYKKGFSKNTQSDIYLTAIKILLSEQNSFRKEQFKISSHKNFSMTLEQKIYLIGRMALLLKMKFKETFYIGNIENTPQTALNIEELNYGIENLNGEIINLSNIDFNEILSTPLFYTNDDLTYSFNNYVFADFLAAFYLHKQKISLQEKLDFISISEEIIYPFSEVASWLAQIDNDFFDLIVNKNSHLLLTSKPIFNETQNEQLINKALELLSEQRINSYDINLKKLIHNNLSKQVKNVINNKESYACRFCLDLIFYGKLLEFQNYLYKQAINNDDIQIKKDALLYLSQIGNKFYKNKLCNKYNEFKDILENKEYDENDNIRAAYLMVLSSNDFSTNKILKLITPRKNLRYCGLYEVYLREFITSLNSENITTILRWAIKQKDKEQQDLTSNITEKIIKKAFLFIDDKKVFNILSKFIYDNLKSNYYSLSQIFENLKPGTDLAKKIFLKIIEKHLKLKEYNTRNYIAYSIYSSFLRDEKDDYIWLCEEYIKLPKCEFKPKLKHFIQKIIIGRFPQKLTEKTIDFLPLYKYFNSNPILINDFGKRNIRIYKYKPQKWEIPTNIPKIDINKNIKKALKDASKNIENSAIYLIEILTMNGNSTYIGNFYLCAEKYPYWTKCSISVQNSILKIFANFFKNATAPKYKDYIHKTQFQYSWFLLAFVPEMINRKILNIDEIKKYLKDWIPFVLLIPDFNNDKGIYQKFTEFYFNLMPDELIKTLTEIIKNKPKNEYPDFLSGFNNINDEKLNSTLFNLLKKYSKKLSAKYNAYILKYLLSNNVPSVLTFGHNLLNSLKNSQSDFIEIASTLLCFATDTTWTKVYNIISKQKENFYLGREVLVAYIDKLPYSGANDTLSNISQENLANYFIWLYQAFPKEEENKKYYSKSNIATTITITDRLYDFKQYLLNKIKNDGCVNAIETISNKIPEINNEWWFNRFAFDTYKNLLVLEWMKSNNSKIFNKTIYYYQNKIKENKNTQNIKIPNFYKKYTKYNLSPKSNDSPADEKIIVFVEDKNDKNFYTNIYDVILKNENKYNFPTSPSLEFYIPEHGTGCNAVKKAVEEGRLNGKKNVFGIVDYDAGKNSETESIFKTQRYAIDNYLIDAIYLLNIMRFSPNCKKLYTPLNDFFNNKIQQSLGEFDINKFANLSEQNLQKISDLIIKQIPEERIKATIKEINVKDFYYYKEKVPVKYLGNKKIEIPRWIHNSKGHSVVEVFKMFNNEWTEDFLISHIKDINICSKDFLDIFNNIIHNYKEQRKYQNNS